MHIKLKKLKNISSENCVTIIMNTHRTRPDNQKDALNLKNLIKEAKNRLLTDINKRDAKQLTEKLNTIADKIDHNHNLESLILFVNKDISEYVRLPIEVENRVVIDNTFATRDLIRALHTNTNYYVLVLSKQKARLIEAYNDKVVEEVGSPFSIENYRFYSTNKAEIANANRQTNLIAEFFNRIDKEVNKIRKNNALPVLICTEESNYHEYLKIADQKNSIFKTYLNKNRLDEKDHAIVTEAWKIVKEFTVNKNNERKNELLNAIDSGKFLNDTNKIWKAVLEGQVQTLFIEQDLFQPAILKNNTITYVPNDKRNEEGIVDDIYDEIIETNMKFGGDVVFLPKGELSKFNGFGAITRY